EALRLRGNSASSNRLNDLAGIKDATRIERLFYRAHHLDAMARFGGEIGFLALTDPMLAGAGPFKGKRPPGNTFREDFGTPNLVRIVHINKRHRMEVPIAHMPGDGHGEAVAGDIGLRLPYASG